MFTCLKFYSRLFSTPQSTKLPTIPLIELHEKFIKGGGPGGQALNKSSSCVQLKHLPTSIIIKTQRFRSLAQNRKEAIKLMQLAIDDLENGKESKRGLKAAKEIEKERKKKSKSKKKYAEKAVESKRNTGESRDLVDGVIRAVEIEQDSLVVKVMGDHVLSIEQDTTDLTEVIKSK